MEGPVRVAIGLILIIYGVQNMSLHFRLYGEPKEKVFDDGRTKQAFKDETDINRILAKYQQTGVMSHLSKFEASYDNFADFDFLEMKVKLVEADGIFNALPSEVRREFDQDTAKFFNFVNNPENRDRLKELLPKIAEPGDYFVDVSSSTPPGTLLNDGEPGEKVEVPDATKEEGS